MTLFLFKASTSIDPHMWEEIVRDIELLASTSAFVLLVRQSGDITVVYESMRQVRLPWIGVSLG